MKQALSHFPPFYVLEDYDFAWLESLGQKKKYESGKVLLGQSKSDSHLYICLSGKLDVTMSSQETNKEQLITFCAGDIIGENLLLDQQGAIVTVQESSELIALPKQELKKRLEQDSQFAARFYHLLSIALSERLRKLTKLMAARNVKEGEPLRKVLVVFATLNDSDIAWMVANGIAEKAALGTTLIQQEQSVPALYLLLEGMLGIYVSIPENGTIVEKEIAKRVKGEILGEMSFVDGGVASASVKSLENAWVLAIPQKMLAEKFKEDYGFAQRFYRSLALILSNRYMDLLIRGSLADQDQSSLQMLSEDIEVEDELDLDVLEGTAIAGSRFDWMIQRLRR